MIGPSREFERACADREVPPLHREALWRLYLEWPGRGVGAEKLTRLFEDYDHWRLFQASWAGDAAAARAFERYWRDAARVYLLRGFSKEQVDELAAAFFARVYERITTFAFATPFLAYLRTVLLNVARDEIRRLRRSRERERSLDHDAAPVAALRDPRRSAEDGVLAGERAGAVQRALARLSADDRRLLVAFVVEGESGEAVAVELGIARDALYQRLRRARLKLRALVQEEMSAK